MTRFYRILGVVAVPGVLAIGYSMFFGQAAAGVSGPVDFGDLQGRELTEAAQGIRVGSDDAPITVMEFGDYQCPACAEFAALHKPAIIRELVETGRVAFVFRDFPLTDIHPNAFLAARAGRCAADQNLFWEYQDHLFGSQSRWTFEANPTGVFVDLAESLGANGGTFRTCISGDAHAEVVSANLALAQALRLPGTPAILLQKGAGTTVIPSYDFRSILAAVEELEAGDAAGG